MAYGGWIRNRVTVGPYVGNGVSNANHKNMFADVLAGLTSLSGWFVKIQATYKEDPTNIAIYAVVEHSGGAEFALIWVGFTNNTNVHADNCRLGQIVGSTGDYHFYCGYIPPGASSEFSNALDPLDSGWLTDPSVAFAIQCLNSELNNASTNSMINLFSIESASFTWQARGDDLMLALEVNSQASTEIDYLSFWGTGFSTLSHDPNDTDKEAYIAYLDDGVGWGSGQPYTIDFFNVAGDLLNGNRTDPVELLRTASQNPVGPPYNMAQMEVYEDSSVAVVYSNDGIKGLINAEVMFMSSFGVPVKSTWNDGTHVLLRSGLWVGSDPTNPAWP